MTMAFAPASNPASATAPAASGITVAICSRNRPELLQRAVRAALEVSPGTPLIVVDQSDDDLRVLAVHEAANSGRLLYHHDRGIGVSRARNIALLLARTDAVLFVDDDCALQPGAVDDMARALERDPDVTIAFGTVRQAWSTGRDGFIPQHLPKRARVLRGRLAKLREHGIGACMAVRRERVLRAGGFDERLGPGTAFPACEEGELAYRVLRAGGALAHVPAAEVVHYGFRPASEGARYAVETYRGIGGSFALHVRAGDPVAAIVLAQHLVLALREIVKQSVRYRRPGGISRLRGLFAGVAAGLAAR